MKILSLFFLIEIKFQSFSKLIYTLISKGLDVFVKMVEQSVLSQ